MDIQTNASDEVLEKLISLGRYKVNAYLDSEKMYLNIPKVTHQVVIRGVTLEETFRFTMYVPKGTVVHSSPPSYYADNK